MFLIKIFRFTLQLKVLYMSNETKYLEDLSQIRNMMEKSTRFLSLSGLSGIFVGAVALVGAAFAQYYYTEFMNVRSDYQSTLHSHNLFVTLKIRYYVIAAFVLTTALLGGYYFTARKAKKQGQAIWTKTSKILLINLFVPLAAGGVFCLGLIYHGAHGFIAPGMLIFYGLSLFGSSKFTFDEIRWLGICEILLGLIALFFIGHGLIFWSIGFGLLHIIYGAAMYVKYDLNK